jgi:hypothetical protein
MERKVCGGALQEKDSLMGFRILLAGHFRLLSPVVHDHTNNHSAGGKSAERREIRERDDINSTNNCQCQIEAMSMQELLHARILDRSDENRNENSTQDSSGRYRNYKTKNERGRRMKKRNPGIGMTS